MIRCSIAPSAIRDLDDISDYFLECNIKAGEKILQEFTRKCRNLATFPIMGKSLQTFDSIYAAYRFRAMSFSID